MKISCEPVRAGPRSLLTHALILVNFAQIRNVPPGAEQGKRIKKTVRLMRIACP